MVVLKDRAQTSAHLPRKIKGYNYARTLQVSRIEYSTRFEAWGYLGAGDDFYSLELLDIDDLLVFSSEDDIPEDIINLIEWEAR